MTVPKFSRFFSIFFALAFVFSANIFCQEETVAPEDGERQLAEIDLENLPEIPLLKSGTVRNPQPFDKYAKEVEANSMLVNSGKNVNLLFYKYKVNKTDGLNNLFKIAARCSLRQETIATLNAIPSAQEELAEGTVLVLPNANGVFVSTEPKSSLEILIANSDAAIAQNKKKLYNVQTARDGRREYFFMQDAKLSPTERAYFLDTALRMPLDAYRLTSAYGMRVSPISGKWKFHNGVDLAAPTGTPVYACKSGTVASARMNDVTFGNYVIVRHDGGMVSLYAHLSAVSVSAGDSVAGGATIGKVGQTGMATGPHLHFEIHVNGSAADPEKLISM